MVEVGMDCDVNEVADVVPLDLLCVVACITSSDKDPERIEVELVFGPADAVGIDGKGGGGNLYPSASVGRSSGVFNKLLSSVMECFLACTGLGVTL